MAAMIQTIAIVDKSNKVVSTSKQLKNVFKEAKLAYLERKAEITAQRAHEEDKKNPRRARGMTLEDADDYSDDASSRASTQRHRSHRRRSHRHHDDHHHRGSSPTRRPTVRDHRHPSAASVYSEASSRRSSRHTSISSRDHSPQPRSPLSQHHHLSTDLNATRSAPVSPARRLSTELIRRRTDNLALTSSPPRPTLPHRSQTTDDIDMDLAYGEYHPSSLALSPATQQTLQKQELASLVTKCKMLLDEANCAQHSVKAIIVHLQKNPDAMAAVALTLAEISNIATKMAPGALMAVKSGAPTVFALLAAPQFLIAVGVGVGLTVVMFGGYKIVKRIRANAARDKEENSVDEMIDVGELDSIENWRRGIADDRFVDDDGAGSVISAATSVEGEFITPMAARSMGHLPQPDTNSKGKGKDKDQTKKEKKKDKQDKKDQDAADKKSRKKHRKSSKSEVGSQAPSSAISTATSTATTTLREKRDKALIMVKKPSPLRRMFNSSGSKDGGSVAS